MSMMDKWISGFLLLWGTVCCAGCEKDEQTAGMPDNAECPIVILYENDVHCEVDGYARLMAVKRGEEAMTPYVATVSCGDFVQGGLVGIVSHGGYVADIMNHVGYDAVAPGNHEFDFGMERLYALTEQLDAPIVCANLRDLRTGEMVFAPYHIVRYGEAEVAFVGLLTSATATSTSPLNYQDSTGRVIYDFMKADFYAHAQRQIDRARAEGADYVVVLAHLGDLPNGEHATSLSLIAATTGIDALLDGHSHSVIADTTVCDREGRPVLLSSTGTKFQHVGVLTIGTDGRLSTRLIPTEGIVPDADMQAFVDEVKKKAGEEGDLTVGHNTVPLTATDEEGNRPVRDREMPLGNLCADALRHMLNTDVALVNGGGIRDNIPRGEVTYNHLLNVFPFGNALCTATLTGTQLADALEVAVRHLPYEDGSFMQVSGIRFRVNAALPSPVIMGSDELFSHVNPDAPRRVSHIYIRNRESGEYVPLDPERTYTLAGFDYHIKELGSEGILRYATLMEDKLGTDVEVLAAYIEQVLGGTIAAPYDKTEGRITIQM